MTIKELVEKNRPGVEQLTEEMREYFARLMTIWLIYRLGQIIYLKGQKKQ